MEESRKVHSGMARLSWAMGKKAREHWLTQRGGQGQEIDQEAKWPK